jgi:NAD(P)H dehydrogenase (quinone)
LKLEIMTKIAIVHYSMYGHVATMSESIKKGVLEAGAECDIFQVAETLPEEVLGKMHAPPKGDYPIITADKLPEYDGILFGIAGRYGSAPAQMRVRQFAIFAPFLNSSQECEGINDDPAFLSL